MFSMHSGIEGGKEHEAVMKVYSLLQLGDLKSLILLLFRGDWPNGVVTFCRNTAEQKAADIIYKDLTETSYQVNK